MNLSKFLYLKHLNEGSDSFVNSQKNIGKLTLLAFLTWVPVAWQTIFQAEATE